MITHYARTQQFEAVLDTVERMQEAGLRPSDITNQILMRHCDVSPEQLQIALQQGTFRGVIPEEVYARQQKLRRPRRERRVAEVSEGVQPEESSTGEASSQGRAEESAPRMGSEAQVEDEPSSSAAAGASRGPVLKICFCQEPIPHLVVCYD
jgi:pentatricopeptide repeat protein